MRVVLDTNVVISGFFWNGSPNDILVSASRKMISLFTSESLLTELSETISRKKFAIRLKESEYTVESLLYTYCSMSTIVVPVEFLDYPSIKDPDDEIVLATAYAASANCIVSGDSHLLDLKRFDIIDIVNPSDFLKNFLHLNKH